MWRGFRIAGQCQTGPRVALPGCGRGLSLGVGLGGCRFLLCWQVYCSAQLLSGHEWGGPQHLAHEGVKSPGILFITWRVQGVMNGWLLVFLFKMCCHKASGAVVRLVAFQGVQKEALHVNANWW